MTTDNEARYPTYDNSWWRNRRVSACSGYYHFTGIIVDISVEHRLGEPRWTIRGEGGNHTMFCPERVDFVALLREEGSDG